MADDHCTNPDEYTIDKRCYVTDEQRKEKPFNSTVPVGLGYGYCTGTLAKWISLSAYFKKPLKTSFDIPHDDAVYLFTAKHCADTDDDGKPDSVFRIELPNYNTLVDSILVASGDYDTLKGTKPEDDWAIYRLPAPINQENIEYVLADTNGKHDNRSVISVGYGLLKIMSDAEIKKFKQEYLNYLTKNNITDMSYDNTGIIPSDGGVNLVQGKAADFIEYLDNFRSEYFVDLFFNIALKFSRCTHTDGGNCQAWGGNSGGPLFDDKQHLVGVYTRGISVIGGDYHAGGSFSVPTGHIYTQMIQKKKNNK